MPFRLLKFLVYLNLVCFLQFTAAKRNFGFRIHFINYTLLRDDLVTNTSVTYYNARNLFKFNFEFVLRQQFSKDVMFNVIIDAIRKDNSKFNLFNFNLDCCKTLENIYNNPLLLIVMKEFRRTSNLPTRCPLTIQKYFVKNFAVNPESYPPFLPTLNFAWQLHVRKGEIYYGYIYAEGEIYKI